VRICPVCKLDYQPRFSSLQKTCNETSCMIKLVEMRRVKSAKAKDKKAFNQKDKGYWKVRVKTECHKYIRARDKGLPCISCGITYGQFQAGHFKPGTHSITRYNTDNINAQCSQCNEKKSGNLTEYRIGLVKKIGLKRVKWLESANEVRKWTIDELKLELDKFKALNKGLKDDQGS
jgi:hypothetical protein